MRTSEALAQINIYSYGRRTPNPPSAKYTINVAMLRDPIGQKSLTSKYEDGRSSEVRDWVEEDERVDAIIDELVGLAFAHVKHAKETFVSIAFVDQHGKWIAPAVAEILANAMETAGFSVHVRHQGLGLCGN